MVPPKWPESVRSGYAMARPPPAPLGSAPQGGVARSRAGAPDLAAQSAGIAAQIQILLQTHGATVRNWAMDFRSGVSILNELEAARRACSCGIFLFSEDDPLEGEHGGAAPRDNVVFEAGHFFSSKGMARCLIIRVGDAKMPADLGGAIYVALDRTGRSNL